MSRNSTGPWGTSQAGGSGPKKRTFETHIGPHSPPRPSKVHRPTPSPRSSAFTTPSNDDWNWNEAGSPMDVIDLTDDDVDLLKKQRDEERAEEERRHERKRQMDSDAVFARRLQMGESPSPTPGPSSRPITVDHMPNADISSYGATSYGATSGYNRQVKTEPSSSFRCNMNSSSDFQPDTMSPYGHAGSYYPQQTFGTGPGQSSNNISRTKSRMPGSFIQDDDVDDDDLFGDKLFGYDVDTNPSFQDYGASTDNSGTLPPSELARQAALQRRQQQFPALSDPWTNNSGGMSSSFMPATQVWNNQSLQRPGSLMNGSANPLDYGASVYTNSYGQSSSGANLGDIIGRTSGYDYASGTDGFGNALDRRILEVANGDDSEQEGIRRLLANLGSSSETLGEDEIADPKELLFPLYKHQRQALHWMTRMEKDAHKKGGILADDMGLGKTISSLALMVSRRAQHSANYNYVKVCPFLDSL